MQYMDCVEVTVEKKEYTVDGVHKGMQGWICMDDFVNGYWLVNFPQCGENKDIATISVKEEDLKVIPVMYAAVNEEIKARFDEAEKTQNLFRSDGRYDRLSDLITELLLPVCPQIFEFPSAL